MKTFVEAIGKFVTAAWEVLAALHRLLAALARRDVESLKRQPVPTNACMATTPRFGPYGHPARVFAYEPLTRQWVDANGHGFAFDQLSDVRYV